MNATTPIWTNWNAGTATNVTAEAWGYWNTASTVATTGAWIQWNGTPVGTLKPLTPEEQAAADDRTRVIRAEWEQRQSRERADRDEAVKRAETLLHTNLTRHQRRMLRTRNRFYVRSQHGRRYEIERGHHANVYEVDRRGQRVSRLCVYPTGGVPEGDCMLAQKLHLQANEEAFRRTAHITPLVGR